MSGSSLKRECQSTKRKYLYFLNNPDDGSVRRQQRHPTPYELTGNMIGYLSCLAGDSAVPTADTTFVTSPSSVVQQFVVQRTTSCSNCKVRESQVLKSRRRHGEGKRRCGGAPKSQDCLAQVRLKHLCNLHLLGVVNLGEGYNL